MERSIHSRMVLIIIISSLPNPNGSFLCYSSKQFFYQTSSSATSNAVICDKNATGCLQRIFRNQQPVCLELSCYSGDDPVPQCRRRSIYDKDDLPNGVFFEVTCVCNTSFCQSPVLNFWRIANDDSTPSFTTPSWRQFTEIDSQAEDRREKAFRYLQSWNYTVFSKKSDTTAETVLAAVFTGCALISSAVVQIAAIQLYIRHIKSNLVKSFNVSSRIVVRRKMDYGNKKEVIARTMGVLRAADREDLAQALLNI